MDFDKVFGTDKDAEMNGVWINNVDGTDFCIKLARLNLPAYIDEVDRYKRPYMKAIRTLEFSAKQRRELEDLNKRALARYIILDWKNMQIDGKDVKYSEAQGYAMLGHDSFYNKVLELADDRENYTKEFIEASEKNL